MWKTTELFGAAKIFVRDPADTEAVSDIQTSKLQAIVSVADDPSWTFNAQYFYNAYEKQFLWNGNKQVLSLIPLLECLIQPRCIC